MKSRCRLASQLMLAISFVISGSAFGQDSSNAQDSEIAQDFPSGESIVSEYIEAMGGEMPLSGLESFKLNGTYNTDSQVVSYYHQGKHIWIPSYSPGVVYKYDGNVLWKETEGSEPVLWLDQREACSSSLAIKPYYAVQWLEDADLKLETVGRKLVNERETWQVKFTSSGRMNLNRFFDIETGLLVRSSVENDALSTFTYEYTEWEGVQVISKIECSRGEEAAFGIVIYDKFELDPDLAGLSFEIPDSLKEAAATELKRREGMALKNREDSKGN